MKKQCSVDGCNAPSSCRGLCRKHYSRWKRHGDPNVGAFVPSKYIGVSCKIEGCDRQAEDAGMCGMHAQRVRRYGDPHYITPESVRRMNNRLAQIESSSRRADTYAKFYGRHEHRVMAEQKLGRPLRRGEVVHHIDGDKRNNAPDNLEVITQSEHINAHRKEMQAAQRRKLGKK